MKKIAMEGGMMYMKYLKIEFSERLKGMKYFWGKRVTGFDEKVHCARCLKGSYLKEVTKDMEKAIIPFEEGEVIYICGVSTPYVHRNNFHLAIKSGNQVIEKTLYNGLKVRIEGAEEIHFNDIIAREKYPNLSAAYLTCRNFQFGAYYFKGKEGD